MPITLLPASAAAFAPRASCNVVLNSKAEPWLTATLKRVNRIKRTLNNVAQHQRCLTETLSAPTAIWTLCSIMLPKAPDAELRRDENPLIEALFNFQLLHIEAYVVHVDMVSQNEVAFKLTTDTIDALVEHHKDIFSVDTAADTWHWSEKEVQLKKLQEDFVQAVNRFVFRAPATALEGLEEDGAGELLAGGADDAKTQILGLFQPLRPPPPRQPDVLRAAPILPSSTGPDPWWSTPLATAAAPTHDAWRALPGPDAATTAGGDASGAALWSHVPLDERAAVAALPSPPTPTYSPSPSFSTVSFGDVDYFPTAPLPTSVPTSMGLESMVPTYPLPSLMAQQCGASAAVGEWNGFGVVDGLDGVGVGIGAWGGMDGFGGFDWERTNAFGHPFAMSM